MIEQRNRIARAIAESDPLGPEDFDEATGQEKYTYDRMGLAALNHAHTYAIHALDTHVAIYAVSTVDGQMTITRDGDPYEVWGEPASEGAPKHLIIGTSDPQTVRDIVRSLSELGVPCDVSNHDDWSEPATVPDLVDHRTWYDWMDEQR